MGRIIYNLKCKHGHGFEGWFQSAADYQQQSEQGLLCCPICDSQDVSKVPTASYVHTRRQDSTYSRADKEYVSLQQIRQLIEQRTENVGADFPEQARKMHYGEIEERPIRGKASVSEIQQLAEEGVDAVILPEALSPDKKLN